MRDYAGKRITVMGLGRFGGGIGAVRFLVRHKAIVTVTDLRTEAELTESIAALEATLPAVWHLGKHTASDFSQADLVVVNPAVHPDNPFLDIARRHDVPLTSEIGMFWKHNRGRVIGVTGSIGKSTTAALIHAILSESGSPCWLGGNIGISLLPDVEHIQPHDWVVLELSSFQLEDFNSLRASPQIAVVTNLKPNHLDRHGTLARYRTAKQNIVRWQQPGQFAVLNLDDPDVAAWPINGYRIWFGTTDFLAEGVYQKGADAVVRIGTTETVLPVGLWSRLRGRHNRQNVLAAIAAAWIAGANAGSIQQGLDGFRPLPHRLELVAQADGRAFVNDSKATTPEATLRALEAFSEPIVLLAGGYDKGIDLSELARGIASKTKAVALMGKTAEILAGAITCQSAGASPRLRCCDSLLEAFQWSVEQSESGDVVLLSPGCASYDWFSDFQDRGRQFTELARGWTALASSRGLAPR